MPLRLNSPTSSTVMVLSTASMTRGLIRICPGLASSQSLLAMLTGGPPIDNAHDAVPSAGAPIVPEIPTVPDIETSH